MSSGFQKTGHMGGGAKGPKMNTQTAVELRKMDPAEVRISQDS